jgi:hypothetical protein
MNKKTFLYIGIAIVLLIFGNVMFQYIKTKPYQSYPYFGYEDRFYGLLQDSIIKDLDKYYSEGNNKETLYAYHYKKNYRIIIWELLDHASMKMSNVNFLENVDLKDIIINPKGMCSIDDSPKIIIESALCEKVQKSINIDFGIGCKLLNQVDCEKYKAFIGQFTKVGIMDESNVYQIIFDFNSVQPKSTELIVYKQMNSLYFFIITSSIEDGLKKCSFKQLLKLD